MNDNSITRGMTKDGNARILIINSKEMVAEAGRVHKASPAALSSLGRVLTATSLIGVMLKDKTDTVTVTFNGNGACGKILAVSDYYGNTRGFVQNTDAMIPLDKDGKPDICGIVGTGTLSVVKDMGKGQPFVGLVPIIEGDIAKAITEYFATSEQVPTVCSFGVSLDKKGNVTSAGGYMIQLLPGADSGFVSKLEKRIPEIPPVSKLFSKGDENAQIIQNILGDIEFDLFDEALVSYMCNCSYEKVEKVILSLGEKEISDIIKTQGSCEVNCQFCNNVYTFSRDKLCEMLTRVSKRINVDEV